MLNAIATFGEAAQLHCWQIAEQIVEEIYTGARTPVLTGTLRASYKVKDDGLGAAVHATAVYWHVVEFGDERGHRAHPHVRPAIDFVRASHFITGRRAR